MRLGKFDIADWLLKSKSELLTEIFAKAKFLPVQIERSWDSATTIYMGTSPYFEEVPHGEIAPRVSIAWESRLSIHDEEIITKLLINGKVVYSVTMSSEIDKTDIFW